MSDTDSFIEEVTEELKRDRMFGLWKRYGALVIGAIVLVVIGTAGKSWYDSQQEAARQTAAAELIEAAKLEAPEARAEAFGAIAAGENGALVAKFRAAESFVEAGDMAKAVAELDAISGDAALDRAYRDLAALKSVQVQYGDRTPAETIAALDGLVAEDAPYRLLALETRAAAHLANSDIDAVRADLELIMADEFVTNELRQRVAQLMAIIGPGES